MGYPGGGGVSIYGVGAEARDLHLWGGCQDRKFPSMGGVPRRRNFLGGVPIRSAKKFDFFRAPQALDKNRYINKTTTHGSVSMRSIQIHNKNRNPMKIEWFRLMLKNVRWHPLKGGGCQKFFWVFSEGVPKLKISIYGGGAKMADHHLWRGCRSSRFASMGEVPYPIIFAIHVTLYNARL